MKSSIYKKLFLLGIKYGPSIMALTCCLKIHLLAHDPTLTHQCEYVVHWINWVLNLFFLGMFYTAGKYFHYCWKHQSLCRITLAGYIYYPIFLILQVPNEEIRYITWWYVFFVSIVTLLYKKL